MSWEIFGWGCLGAVFPEFVRHFELRLQKVEVPFSYYIITSLFIAASGLVVVALPGDLAPLTAIYAGAAAPLIVSKGAEKILSSPVISPSDLPDMAAGDTIDDVSDIGDSKEIYVKVKETFVAATGWARFILSL
jgi:hypothetical protein